MSESSVILARLSFKKHHCKTLRLCHVEPNQHAYIRILQPYNIRVAHKPTTTSRQLLTNVKDRDEPNNRQGAVYKIKCSGCQASYIGETGRNLNTRLTEHKRATRNGDANNHIAVHHQLTNHNIDWDSAQCLPYSTNYFGSFKFSGKPVDFKTSLDFKTRHDTKPPRSSLVLQNWDSFQ